MDPPPPDGGFERDNFEEVKEGGPMHHCTLFDAEVTYKIAEAILPGLASACVDNTIGVLFKTPGSVAVEMRKEMVDTLIQRSETFVAEAVVLDGESENEVPPHPFDIISDFIDDFAGSKKNFFSRVSGWMMSDKREDRIDDFVQEMEIDGFWMIGRREAVAQDLLKNVDFKDAFHCNKKFNTADELVEHLPQCRFRTVHCPNEGCDDQFSAGNSEIHDAVCPFKMLPCEQNCSEILMRRDMDRHCITVCPMKHVNCPFSSVGCEASIPRSMLEQHKVDNVHSHVFSILLSIHKEAETEDLNRRVDQLLELSSPEQLAKPQNVRSLTTLIKNLEEKLGPLEAMPITTSTEKLPSQKEKSTDPPEKKEEHVESSNTKEVRTQPPAENKSIESPIENKDSSHSPVSREELSTSSAKSESSEVSSAKTEELIDSPNKNRTMQSPAKEQHLTESLDENDLLTRQGKKEELLDSPTKEISRKSPSKEERPADSFAVAKDVSDPTAKTEDHKESSEEYKKDEGTYSSTKEQEHDELLVEKDEIKKEEQKISPVQTEEHRETPTNGEVHDGSSKQSKEPPQEMKVHEGSSSDEAKS